MHIRFIHASCVEQSVDVIVNAANKYLLAGDGVCGAIFQKAGYEQLTEACSRIPTPLEDGDAVITPAFELTNAKYIIHAVGPNFSLIPNHFDTLMNAYYHSLELAKEYQLHSIAFPLISSGIYAGNLEHPSIESYKQCYKAYQLFQKTYPDYDIDVVVCCYSESSYLEIKNWEESYGNRN